MNAAAFLGLDDLARLPAYFQHRIRPQAITGCWEWRGSITGNNDRPKCSPVVGAGETLAHRAVAVLLDGPPPTDRPIAMHNCHNRHCVRFGAGHVQWGTVAENVAARTAIDGQPRGERNGRAKLTAADVAAVRNNRITVAQLVAARQMSADYVARVVAGHNWPGVR